MAAKSHPYYTMMQIVPHRDSIVKSIIDQQLKQIDQLIQKIDPKGKKTQAVIIHEVALEIRNTIQTAFTTHQIQADPQYLTSTIFRKVNDYFQEKKRA